MGMGNHKSLVLVFNNGMPILRKITAKASEKEKEKPFIRLKSVPNAWHRFLGVDQNQPQR